MKYLFLAAFGACLLVSCSKNADPSVTSTVTLSMSARTSSGTPLINGRVATAVALSDIQVSVGDIKFDFDQGEDHHQHDSTSVGDNEEGEDHNQEGSDSTSEEESDSTSVNTSDDDDQNAHDSSFVDDTKLMGPFIVDLMNAGTFVDQVIASINLPNAKYEKVSFKLVPSLVEGSMHGKSILITGTIEGTPFEFWHNRDTRFGARLADSAVLTTDGAALNLAIQLELDKILSAVNGGVDLSTAVDGNQDGTITIDPLNTDGNKHLADAIMNLLVRHTECRKEND